MAELSTSEPRRNNRANWIGLRTLRQVPRVVGRTTTGDSIFEVRSVRLVLPADAAHFNRMLSCSACGRDVPGPPVLTAGDLDHRAHSVICGHCARTAEAPASAPDERRSAAAERRTLGDVSRKGAGNGHGPVRATGDDRLASLEQRMAELTEVVGDLSGRAEAEPADGPAGVLVRGEELGRVQDQMGGRLARLTERLAQQAEAERGRLRALAGRLQRLELASHLVVPHRPHEAQAAADGAPQSGRLQALERRLHDAVCRLTEALNAHRVELRDGLRQGLDELRATVTADAAAGAGRLEALEEDARQRELEVSELRELQAVLDSGMGELRAGVAAVRDGNTQLANAQVEVERRLEALADVQRAARAEPGGGRGLGKRSAKANARVGVVSAAVDELVREQQRLRAQLASLEQATGAVAVEAARASTRASAVVPVRRDVRALHEQVVAQNEALDAVRRSVERLGRRIPARAPAAKRAPRATKA